MSQSPWSINYFYDKNNTSLVTEFYLRSVVSLLNSPITRLDIGAVILKRNAEEKIVNGKKKTYHTMQVYGRCVTAKFFGQQGQHVIIDIDSNYQIKTKIVSTKNDGTIIFIIYPDQVEKVYTGKKIKIIYPDTDNKGPTFFLQCFKKKWTEGFVRAGLTKLPKGSTIDDLKCN